MNLFRKIKQGRHSRASASSFLRKRFVIPAQAGIHPLLTSSVLFSYRLPFVFLTLFLLLTTIHIPLSFAADSWLQTGSAGLGDPNNTEFDRGVQFWNGVSSFTYFGSKNTVSGSGVFRSSDGITWTQANTSGFGITSNVGGVWVASFNNAVYEGIANVPLGSRVYRSATGVNPWTLVWSSNTTGNSNESTPGGNYEVYQSSFFVGTKNSVTGLDLYSSTSATSATSSWVQIATAGFNQGVTNEQLAYFRVFSDGNLYAGTNKSVVGASGAGQLWYTNGSGPWTQILFATAAFSVNTWSVSTLESFNGYLYLGTLNSNGCQLWRSSTPLNVASWTQVITPDGISATRFSVNTSSEIHSMNAYNGYLYTGTWDTTGGARIYKSSDGVTWTLSNYPGFGNSANQWVGGFVGMGNYVYAGIRNDISGGTIYGLYVGSATLLNPSFSGVMSSSLTVTWANISSSTSYNAVISTDNTFGVNLSSSLLNANTTSYLNLINNATYYFKVKVSTEADGSYQLISTVTLLGGLVSVSSPTMTQVVVASPTAIIISFADNSTNEDDFHLYQDINPNASIDVQTVLTSTKAGTVTAKGYVFGGNDSGGNRSDIQEYNPVTDSISTKTATLPTARYYTSVAYNPATGKFYIFGGANSGGYMSNIQEYNPVTDSISTKTATLPTARGITSAAYNPATGKIYVFGGYNGIAWYSDILEYNPFTDTLVTKTATLPTARQGTSAAYNPATGKIYVFGGNFNGGTDYSDIQEYNPVTDSISTKTATLPTARNLTSAAYNPATGKIYVFGGQYGGGTNLSNILEYNPVTDALTTKTATLPTTRFGTSAAYNPATGKIYVFGGDGASYYSDIQEYNVVTDTLVAKAATLPTGRYGTSADGFPGISVTMNNLSANTKYYFRTKARADATDSYSPYSNELSTYTAAYPPTGTSLSMVSYTSLMVNWSGNGNPAQTDYNIRYSTNSDFSFSLTSFAANAGLSPSWNLNSLSSLTTYYFRIQAQNKGGYLTGYDLTLTTTTLGTMLNPSFGSINASSVTVTWTNVTGSTYIAAISSYSAFTTVTSSISVTSNTTSFANLSVNTGYYFKVKLSTEPDGSYSNPAISTTTLTNAPSGSSFTAINASSFTVGWNANGNPSGITYQVQFTTDVLFSVFGTSSTAALTFSTQSLSEATTYYVRVRSQNSNGVYSAFDVTLATLTHRVTPQNLTWNAPIIGNPALASFAFNWTPTGPPITGDNIFFNATSTQPCTWDVGGITLSSFTVTSGYPTSVTITLSTNIVLTGSFTKYGAAGGGNPVKIRFVGATREEISGNGQIPGNIEIASSSDVFMTSALTTGGTGIGQISLFSGALHAGSFNQSLNDNFLQTGGTFYAETSTISFIGGASGPQTITTLPGNPFNNFTINSSSSVTALSALTINNNFTLSGGTFVPGAYNHSIGGNWTETGGSFTANIGTITFNGTTSTQTITQLVGNNFYNFQVTNPSSPVKLLSNIAVAGNILQNNPGQSFDFSNQQVTLSGNYSWIGGNFTFSGSTLVLNGTQNQTMGTGVNLNSVLISNSGGAQATLNSVINGNLNINSGSILNGANQNITLPGSITSSGTYLNTGGTITVNSSNNSTLWTTASSTFNNVVFSGSANMNVLSNLAINGNLVLMGGTLSNFDLGNKTHVVQGTTTVNSGTLNIRSSSITFNNPVNVNGGTFQMNTLSPPGKVSFPSGQQINVNAGGTILATTGTITSSDASTGQRILINGGAVNITALQIDYIPSGGSPAMQVNAGSTVTSLANISFGPNNGGANPRDLLFNQYSGTFTFNGMNFNTSITTPTGYNISAPNLAGNASNYIMMTNATGAGAGPAYENDPNNVIFWSTPQSPSGLIAQNVGSSSITWQWNDDSIDRVGYKVFSTTGGSISGNLTLQTTMQAPRNYTQNSLTPNTSYSVYVQAFNPIANSSSTLAVSTYTPANPPTLAGFQVYSTSISVTLNANANPVGTPLMISTGTGGLFGVALSSVGIVASTNTTTLVISGLNLNAVYGIQAGAVNNAVSAATQTIIVTNSTTTLAAPPLMNGFQVFTTSVSITLGANGNAVGTALLISTGTGGYFNVSQSSIGIVSGANTTLVISNLSTNTAYGFQAGSLGSALNSSTNTITVTASTYTLAAPPLLSSYSVYTTSISVTLASNGNPVGTGLAISTGTGGNFTVLNSSYGIVSGGNTALVIGGLAANTVYGIQAAAWNGNVPASTQTTVITASTATLPPITLLSPSFSAVNVTSLTVTYSTISGASYNTVISTSSNFSINVSSAIFSSNTTNYVNLNLNTTYYFEVKITTESDLSYAPSSISTTTLPDTTPPGISIAFPANNSYQNSVTQATGTSVDNVAVSTVQVAVIRVSDNFYWNGSSFTSTQTFLGASGLSSWSFTSVPAWVNGSSYTIAARAKDSSNNYSVPNSSSIFTYDVTPPVSATTSPVNGVTLNSLPTIAGTASDNLSLSQVQFAIRNNATGLYLGGSVFSISVQTNAFITASGAGVWSYAFTPGSSFLADATSYQIYSRAQDSAGNYEAVSATGTIFYFDRLSPVLFSGVTASSLTVTWTSVGLSYNAVVSTSSNFSVNISSSLISTNTTGYTGLSGNTTYYFKVKVSTEPDSFYTSPAVSTMTLGAPPAITGFQVYTTSVSVTIGANGNANGTQIMISTGTSGNFSVANSSIGVVGGANTVLAITGLSTNTVYAFQAGSVGSAPNSSTSTVVVTASTNTLSVPPALFGFQVFNTSVAVILGLNTNPVGTTLVITTGSFGVSESSAIGAYYLPNSTVVISGLTPNTNYTIQARSSNGTGYPSNTITVAGSTATLPNVPGASAFTAVGANSISISWGANGNPLTPPTSYQMQVSTDPGFVIYTASVTFLTQASTGSLSSNTTYYLRTQAYGIGGTNSAFNSVISTVTPPAVPVVTGFQVSSNSISVTLSANGNNAGTTLSITTGSFGVAESSSGIASGGNTALAMTNLTPNTPYTILARAVGSNNVLSGNVTVASTGTSAAVPGASAFTAVGANSISISWGANGNPLTPPTSYQMQASTDNTFSVYSTSITFLTQGSSNTLALNTTYFFRVVAFNAIGSGMSAYNAVVTTVTGVNSPGVVSYQINATSISVTLSPNGDPAGTTLSITTGAFNVAESSSGLSGAGNTALVLSNLTANTNYTVQTRAIGFSGSLSSATTVTSSYTLSNIPVITGFQVYNTSVTVSLGLNGNSAGTTLSVTTGAFGVAESSSGALTTLTLSNLIPNSVYTLQARSVNGNGLPSGALSVTASTTTLANSPVVSGFQVYSTTISVTLSANGNPVGTPLMISTGTGGFYGVTNSSVGVVSGANTTLVISVLNGNTAYAIQAGAANSAVGASTQTIVVTNSTNTLATAPTVISFQVFATSVSVTLGQNGNSVGTPLMISTGSGSFGVPASSVGVVSGLNTTLVISGLTPNTFYNFQAGAANGGAGTSTQAVTITASTTTLAASPVVSGFQIYTTSISVTLGANANPVGTPLMISTGTGGFFGVTNSSVGIVSGANTVLVISNLSTNTAYAFQAGAANNAVGATTQTIIVTNSTTTLAAPPVVNSFQVFTTSVSVTIGANGNANGTQIMISTGTGGNFSVSLSSIGIVGGANTTLVISNLSTNTAYGFQAGSVGSAPNSSTNTVIVTASTTTLSVPPTLFGFQVLNTSISVIMGLNTNPLGTTLAITTGSFGVAESSSIVTYYLPNSTAIISGLVPNTAYTVQARSVNGNGQPSGAVSVTGSTATLPNVPGASAFTAVGANSISISWGANGNPLTPPTSYQMQVSTDIAFGVSNSSNTSLTQGSIAGLTANATYYTRVLTYGIGGTNSAYTAVASTITSPAIPSLVSFQVYTTSISVTLSPNGNTAGTTLSITTGSFGVAESSSALSTSGNTTFVMSNLTPNTTYTVQTRGSGNNNISGSQQIITSTATLPAVPGASVFTAVGANSISISWGANGNPLTPPTSYQMQASTDNTFGVYSTSITFLTQGTTNTLALNTTYFFRVLAYGIGGTNSGYNTTVTTVTGVNSPGVVSFQIYNTSISVTLSPNGDPAGTTLSITTGAFNVAESSSGLSGAGNTALVLSGLTANTLYTVQTRAMGFSGSLSSATTVTSSTYTLANVPDAINGAPLPGFQVYNTSVSVIMGLNGNSAGTTLSITTGVFGVAESSSGIVSGSSATLAMIGIIPNTVYSIQARSVNGNGLPSNAVTVTGSTATLPNVPGANSFNVVNTNSISISWPANGNPLTPPTSYQMQVSTDSGFGIYTASNTFLTQASTGSLSSNTTYYLRVQAYGIGGTNSAFNSIISTVTTPAVPSVPGYQIYTTSISVTLSPNGNSAGTTLSITTGAFGVTESSSAPSGAGNTTLILSNLTANSAYTIQTRASGLANASSNLVVASTATNAAVPGATGFVSVGAYSISVSWGNNGNSLTPPTSYQMQASTDSGFGVYSTSITFLTQASTNTLSPNTTYYFRTSAFNAVGSGMSAFNSVISTVTPPTSPGVVSFQVTATAISVTLSPNNNLAGTNISITTGTFGVAESSSGLSGIGNITLTLSNLTPNTNYTVQTRALGFTGILSSATTVTASTNTLAAVPIVNGFQIFNTSVSFTLGANSNPTGTALMVSTGTGSGNFVVPASSIGIVAGANTTLVISGLAPNTVYSFQAGARDSSASASTQTVVVTFSTATLPNMPGSINFNSVSASSMTVSWSANGNPLTPPTSYQVQATTDSAFGVYNTSVTFLTQAIFSGLTSNATYYLRAFAYGISGNNSAFDSTVSTVTPPIVPAVLGFQVYNTSVSVTLSPNGNSAGTTLSVTTGSFGTAESSSAFSGAGNMSLVLSNLTPNTGYTIQTRAVGSSNNSSVVGTVASTATLPNVPGAISVLSVSSSSVMVSWTANGNPLTPPTSYQLQASTDSGFGVYSTSNTFSTQASSSALFANTTYYFRTLAYGVGGTNSSYNAAVATATLIAPPVILGFQVYYSSISATISPNGNGAGTVLTMTTGTFGLAESSSVLSGAGNSVIVMNGLTANSAYTVNTRASGLSVSSSVLVASTATYPAIPGANNFVSIGANSISISWSNNGNSLTPPTSYQMQTSTDSAFGVYSTSVTYITQATAGGLTPNTTYFLRTSAYGLGGSNSPFNSVVSTVTGVNSPGVVSYQINATSISVTLAPNGDPVGTLLSITTGSFGVSESSSGLLGSGNMTLILNNLSLNTNYTFQTRAQGIVGQISSATSVTTSYTLSNIPLLTGFQVFNTSVTVMLGLNGNPSGTTLSITTGSFGVAESSSGIASTGSTTLAMTGLGANSLYVLQARSVNGSGTPSGSISVTGSTATLPNVPGAGTFTSIGANSIIAAWGANGNSLTPPTSYQMQVSTDPGFGVYSASVTFLTQGSTTGLVTSSNYYFRVLAYGVSGTNSAYNSVFSTVTTANSPGIVSYQVNATSVSVILSPNNSIGTTLTITTGSFGVAESSSALSTLSLTTLTLSGLTPNWNITVNARGSNGAGVSSTTLITSGPTLANPPLITGYQVFNTSITVNLGLNGNPSTSTVLGFTVGSFTATDSTSTVGGGILTLSGLTPNSPYPILARALNSNSVASPMNVTASTSTLPNLPGVSSFISIGANAIAVSWDNNNNPLTPPTSYQMLASTDPAFSISNASVTYLTQATFGSLSAFTTYYFKVQAYGIGGTNSAFNTVISTLTGADSPGLVSYQVNTTSIAVTISPVGNPVGTTLMITTGSFGLAESSSALSTAGNTALVLSNLTPNGNYTVQTRAQASVGGTMVLSSATVITSTYTLSVPPVINGFKVYTTSISVSFGLNGNASGTTLSITTGSFGTAETVSAGTTNFAMTNLVANSAYSLQAMSVNGNGLPSVPVTITASTATLPAKPGANGFTSVGANSIAISWSSSGNSLTPPTSYQVLASTDSNFGVYSTSVTYLTQASTDTLSANTTYYFKVQAYGIGGTNSAFNAVVSTVTGVNQPNVVSVQVSSTSISVTLSPNGNSAGTTLIITTGAFGVTQSSSGLSGLGNSTLTITNLSVNTSYTLQARAQAVIGGLTDISSPTASQTNYTLTDTPGPASITNVAPSSFTVTWSQGNNPAGTQFLAVISTDPAFGAFRNTQLLGVTTNFVNLLNTVTYYAKVTGVNGNGLTGTYDNIVSTFMPDLTPPDPVSAMSAANTGLAGQALFSWTVPQEHGALPVPVQYDIRYAPFAFNDSTFSSQPSILVSTSGQNVGQNLSVLITGLTVGANYNFRMKAIDIVGNTSLIDVAPAVFLIVGGNTVAPPAITDLTAQANGQSGVIQLSWTVPASSPSSTIAPSGFNIRWNTADFSSSTFFSIPNSANLVPTVAPNQKQYYTVAGLTNNVTYFFHIVSSNSVAGGLTSLIDASASYFDRPGDRFPPNPVSNLSATNTGNGGIVNLTWTAPSDPLPAGDVPSGFTIYYSTISLNSGNLSQSSSVVVSGSVSVGQALSQNITGLTVGQVWYFRISGFDASGNVSSLDTGPLQAVSVTGKTTAPGVINNLAALTGTSQGAIALTWTVPPQVSGLTTSGPPASYDLRIATFAFDNTSFSSQTAFSISNATYTVGQTFNYSIAGLTAGQTYYFHIKDIDSSGNISPLDTVSPQAQAQAGFVVAGQIAGKVTMSNGQAITGVQVTATPENAVAPVVTVYTLTDGSFQLAGLQTNITYTVTVTWTVNGINSSAYRSGISPVNSSALNFTLEVTYQLTTVTGQVPIPASIKEAFRRSHPFFGAPGSPEPGPAFVQLMQNGRVIVKQNTDINGNYSIPNLLPGVYQVQAFNGRSYSDVQTVQLNGGTFAMVFKFALLPEEGVYNYPNPIVVSNTGAKTTLKFDAGVSADQGLEAEINIYTLTGELVRKVPLNAFNSLDGVTYKYDWDLSNSGGEQVAPGIYLMQVRAHNAKTDERAVVTKKIAIIR